MFSSSILTDDCRYGKQYKSVHCGPHKMFPNSCLCASDIDLKHPRLHWKQATCWCMSCPKLHVFGKDRCGASNIFHTKTSYIAHSKIRPLCFCHFPGTWNKRTQRTHLILYDLNYPCWKPFCRFVPFYNWLNNVILLLRVISNHMI